MWLKSPRDGSRGRGSSHQDCHRVQPPVFRELCSCPELRICAVVCTYECTHMENTEKQTWFESFVVLLGKKVRNVARKSRWGRARESPSRWVRLLWGNERRPLESATPSVSLGRSWPLQTGWLWEKAGQFRQCAYMWFKVKIGHLSPCAKF